MIYHSHLNKARHIKVLQIQTYFQCAEIRNVIFATRMMNVFIVKKDTRFMKRAYAEKVSGLLVL